MHIFIGAFFAWSTSLIEWVAVVFSSKIVFSKSDNAVEWQAQVGEARVVSGSRIEVSVVAVWFGQEVSENVELVKDDCTELGRLVDAC